MKWADYRKRLGLSFNDDDRFNQFKNMLENELYIVKEVSKSDINYLTFSDFDIRKFINTAIISITDLKYNSKNIFDFLLEKLGEITNYLEYVALMVLFVNCINNNNKYKQILREKLIRCLQESGMCFDIVEDDDDFFILPGGAKELDDSLVSEPLEWLSQYSQSRVVFVKALKMYSNSVDYDARTVADQFRKAIESFFQEFFNSAKSLENYKSEYSDFLKSKGIPAEISNNFTTLLQLYTNYMNNYVKHHDKTANNVLEYIMYQTGNIIRLLIKLKEE